MFGHVLMRGLVTAKRYSAGLASAQMDPVAANFNALFANQFVA
jgi:hypothetical protein